MYKAAETSKQWTDERIRREKTSGFVTALVLTGEKDCPSLSDCDSITWSNSYESIFERNPFRILLALV
jgi:hypothetical protein